jgi:lysophospholipase L1-like esterase
LRDHACVWVWLAVFAALVVWGCAAASVPNPSPATEPAKIRYVALGDSYTIGTSVGESERWPNQLVARLGPGVGIELVANLGVNGYSSADLIRVELPRLDDLRPDFVSVLIGVNDVVRGVPRDTYKANLDVIFGALLERVPASRIVFVSTPDYTRTPSGADFGDPLQQRAAISDFNSIERAAAETRGIAFVDISAVADSVESDPALVALDGLHPSGKQYSAWVDLVAPLVESLVAR